MKKLYGLKIGRRYLILVHDCVRGTFFPTWTPRKLDADGFREVKAKRLARMYGAETYVIGEDK